MDEEESQYVDIFKDQATPEISKMKEIWGNMFGERFYISNSEKEILRLQLCEHFKYTLHNDEIFITKGANEVVTSEKNYRTLLETQFYCYTKMYPLYVLAKALNMEKDFEHLHIGVK